MAAQQTLFDDPLPELPDGITLFRRRIGEADSRAILDAMLGVFEAAPPYRLRMKTGAYVINRMTNCGAYGWHSDADGYRYIDRHPKQGTPWPEIPGAVAEAGMAAAAECGAPFVPDACLVNLYESGGRLSQHQDHDESDFRWPIVSFSFGADAIFALGGASRRDPVTDMRLHHGDVLVMHGPGRMRFHGVKKVMPGTAPFAHPAIPADGRLNLTLRRAR